jgi:DNA-binding response OmpR family regulator
MPTPSPTVLVVDNEPEFINFVVTNLKPRGYEVVSAKSGTEALSVAGEQPIDAAVIDIMLPNVDGISVCRILRAKSSSVGILAVSADVRPLIRELVLKAGADAFLAKPFGVGEFMHQLREVLRAST